jgi:hypothetical protein
LHPCTTEKSLSSFCFVLNEQPKPDCVNQLVQIKGPRRDRLWLPRQPKRKNERLLID